MIATLKTRPLLLCLMQILANSILETFLNGRIEGWIDNASALTLDEMSQEEVYTKVATELAKLHTVEMPRKATGSLW